MGSGADQRNLALAKRCANLAKDGFTHRAIAQLVGKRPEQIKALIALGERVQDGQTVEEHRNG